MKDILAEAGDLRGRLMAVFANCIPDKMDFIEGMSLVSILSQIGIVDLRDEDIHIDLTIDDNTAISDTNDDAADDDDNDEDKDDKMWSYEMDDDGRITKLEIFDENLAPFDLPAGIARLERLTDITVWNCKSLPVKELCNLRLHTLRLHRCSDLLNKFPIEMRLKFLKKLYIDSCRLHPSSTLLAWMVSQLPILEYLEFNDMLEKEINRIVDVLCSNPNGAACFQGSLTSLVISCCRLGDKQFEILMFEGMSCYPNVSSLNVMGNNIRSVQSIMDRIKSNDYDEETISKAIRHLHIVANPIMKNMKDDVNEVVAILTFLKTFNTIYNLGSISITNCNDVEDASSNEWARMTSSFIKKLSVA